MDSFPLSWQAPTLQGPGRAAPLLYIYHRPSGRCLRSNWRTNQSLRRLGRARFKKTLPATNEPGDFSNLRGILTLNCFNAAVRCSPTKKISPLASESVNNTEIPYPIHLIGLECTGVSKLRHRPPKFVINSTGHSPRVPNSIEKRIAHEIVSRDASIAGVFVGISKSTTMSTEALCAAPPEAPSLQVGTVQQQWVLAICV